MNQKEFSNYIIAGLLKELPQFEEHCIYKPHGVVDIEHYSKQHKVILWLTTQDKEVTVGISGNHEFTDYHTHMGLFGANTPDEELREAINLIKRIITNKEEIIYSNISGYSLGNIDEMREKRQPGEQIEITYWHEL